MKKVIFGLFLSISGYCQDVLTLNTGEAIKTKILEITPEEIKYKAFDNIDGPTITIYKSEASSIKFKNGSVMEFKVKPVPKPIVKVSPPKYSSDKIFFKDERVIECIVLEIKHDEIVYKTPENEDVSFTIPKAEVASIVFKNGTIRKMDGEKQDEYRLQKEQVPTDEVHQNVRNQSPPTGQKSALVQEELPIVNSFSNNGQQNIVNNDMYLRGQNDAKLYYKGYKGAATGTFLVTFLTFPALGLIPAISCSSARPKKDKLTFPDYHLAQNTQYLDGYTTKAHSIKSGKVWKNFGIATGLVVIFIATFAATSMH